MPLGAARFGLLGGVDPGKLELIETQTVDDPDFSDSIQVVDFTSLGDYNVHFLTYNNLFVQGYGYPSLRFFESGVLETASVYQYAYQDGISSNTFNQLRSTSDDMLRMGKNAYQNLNGYAYMYNLSDSAKYSFTTFHSSMVEGNNLGSQMSFGSGVLPQASVVDGIRFLTDPIQLIGTANVSLYGIAES
tara:strand:- start:31 stop:597 length:567 start_codon:yes stop_codon:yes gene_type:complete